MTVPGGTLGSKRQGSWLEVASGVERDWGFLEATEKRKILNKKNGGSFYFHSFVYELEKVKTNRRT